MTSTFLTRITYSLATAAAMASFAVGLSAAAHAEPTDVAPPVPVVDEAPVAELPPPPPVELPPPPPVDDDDDWAEQHRRWESGYHFDPVQGGFTFGHQQIPTTYTPPTNRY